MAGCVFNIEAKFPSIPKKYFYTNYANIDEKVDEILAYQNGHTHLLIADVSFSDNKDSLRRLYNSFKSCTHIDHHMYPEGFWDEFPNMKVVWDKSRSATKLCYDYFNNSDKNQRLFKLTEMINIYDLWKDKHPAFDFAQMLNEYFWEVGQDYFIDEIIKNDFKLPDNFKAVTDSIRERQEKEIAYFESKGYIQRSGEISIAFVNDWFNQILIKEMKDGKNFVIGANSYGIMRIRVNQDAPYSEEQLKNIRLELTGNAEYGHSHAFTYKVDGNFDRILEEVNKIVNVIGKCTSE